MEYASALASRRSGAGDKRLLSLVTAFLHAGVLPTNVVDDY